MDPITIGVMYYSAGARVPVEAGLRTIGHTSFDPDVKQQVFWFASIADFDKVKREIFEMNGFSRPVPVWKFPKAAEVAPEAIVDAPPAVIPPPPPPSPPTGEAVAVSELSDNIFAAHAGKPIRLNDFAAKLGLSPDLLRDVINKDSRYATIPPNGWVRLADDTSPPPAE